MTHLLRLLLALLLLSLIGCPPGRGRGGGGGGDDDDATGDDDDATGDDDDATGDDDDATGDDDDATGNGDATSHFGDLPCEEEIDVWGLDLTAGEEVALRVDTVAMGTTFDPAVSLYAAPDPDNATFIDSADDSFDCTFPPPEYQCPELIVVVQETATYGIAVENYGCANKDGASYDLQITVGGVGRTATLVLDDYVGGGTSTDPPQE